MRKTKLDLARSMSEVSDRIDRSISTLIGFSRILLPFTVISKLSTARIFKILLISSDHQAIKNQAKSLMCLPCSEIFVKEILEMYQQMLNKILLHSPNCFVLVE
jgi:hypothetical protein